MRLHVMDLQPGDRIAADTFNNHGVLVLPAEHILDGEDITILLRHNIDYIDILRGDLLRAVETTPLDMIPVQLAQKFDNAISGIEALFRQSVQQGKIDPLIVEQQFTPLIHTLSQEHDVVSLFLKLSGKDDYTMEHSVQVGLLSYFMAKSIGKSESDAQLAGQAGFLHDIGKCKIPNEILNKPGKLTAEELIEIRKHPIYGYNILKNSDVPEVIALAALQHHERLSGTGYPYGVKENQLHPVSKIVAVADIYSAMISNRVYQRKRDLLTVLKELHRLSFSEIDPEVTQAFIKRMIPQFLGKKATLTNGDNGQIIMMIPTDPFHPLVQIGERFIWLGQHPDLQIESIEI